MLLTLFTVILSAYIRLSEVGVGCEGWPACYAQLNPELEKKGITVLTEQGQQMSHYGARVAHRYIASVLGIFIVIVFVVSLRQGRARSTGALVPWAIMAITVFLSLLGYYTPTRSNPLITMGNLLGGMALLGLLWWLLQRDTEKISPAAGVARFRGVVRLALCLVLLQIVLGGWSSANYASGNCPGLLECTGEWLSPEQAQDAFNPLRDIELDNTGQAIRPAGLGLLSMVHRVCALLLAVYLAWLVRKVKVEPELAASAIAVSVFSIGQIVAGVSMIWFAMPLVMATLHNALAAGLLLSSINLLHRLTPARGLPPPG